MEKFIHCDGKHECLILYNHYSRPTNLINAIIFKNHDMESFIIFIRGLCRCIQFTFCHYNHKIQCTSTLLCNI